MAKLTKAEKIIAGLRASGAIEINHKTTKYRVFYKPGGWYFVGRSGALRLNRKSPNVTDSISLPDQVVNNYIKLGGHDA